MQQANPKDCFRVSKRDQIRHTPKPFHSENATKSDLRHRYTVPRITENHVQTLDFDDPVLLRTVLLENAYNAHWATSDKNSWLTRALLIWLHHTLGKRVHTLGRCTVTNLLNVVQSRI